MKEVTDPAVLGQLEAKEVTDERILSLLNMETKMPDVRTTYQRAAQGATETVGQELGPLAETFARFVIPQNEAEAGALLGSLGAQGIVSKAGLTGLKAAATRVGGAAIGGEAGGQLGGEPTGTGATLGIAGGIGGEVVTPAAGWIARSLPGMKQHINRIRSAEIGKIIEEKVPPLSGARDPHALDQMAKDFTVGKGPLFAYYDMLKNNLQAHLGGRKLKIPELVSDANKQTASAIEAQIAANQGQYTPQHVAQMRATVEDLRSVPISEVYEELKQAGHYGFGGAKANPSTRTIVGEGPRMEYHALTSKTKSELNRLDPTGALANEFESGRNVAAAGFTFLKALQSPRAFLRYPKDVQLNIPWLQEYVNQNQTEIKRKIGNEAFAKLREALWPGGGKMGTRDIPAIGGGGAEDVAGETLRGVGGSPRILTSPLRMLLPSIGAQYAGRPPYSPSGGVRSLMDILTQRGLAPFAPKKEQP